MTLDEIKQLVELLMQSGVAELEVQRGEDRVRIRRAPKTMEVVTPAAVPASAVPASASAATPTPAVPAAAPTPPAAETNLLVVKSPIVGTYYDSASPGSQPFVKVGDTVQPGQVLCIIESMKLMNEIESEVSGVVASKLVENGRPVEYGEALFTVRPS